MKKQLLILVFVLTFGFQLKGYAQVFWNDNFETSGPSSGTRTTSVTPGGSGDSYFTQVTGSNTGINQNTAFSNFSGNNYWAGEDHDGYVSGTPELNLSYTNISVAGYTNLSFTCKFAAYNSTSTWESSDYIIVEYAFDNGSFSPLLQFRPISNVDKRLAIDADFDGNGDPDGAVLATSFANFTKAISGTGNTLTLRVRVFANGNAEEWGIDDLSLKHVPSCVAPTFTTHPQFNRAVCAGSNTSFSAFASNATAFKWQVNTGSGFMDLTNGAPYSNVTSNTLTITGATAAMSGYRYRAVASNGSSSCFTNSNFGTLSVSTLSIPAPNITPVSCNGRNDGGASISPTGGTAPYTYEWSNGATTSYITGMYAGTYSVTVRDAAGCSVTRSSIGITEPTVLNGTASVTSVSTPGGEDGAIIISPIGGNGGYTYLWSNGAITKDLTGVVAGTYSVTITDAKGCTKVLSATVTQPEIITVSAIDRSSTNPTKASTVNYTVTFTASVTGVDASDFSLDQSAGITSATIGTPTGSGTTWTVPITSIVGNGTLRLDFTGLTGVTPNVSTSFTTGQTYIFDQAGPALPTGLSAARGNVENVLSWNSNSELDLAAYKVYGGTSANPTTLLQTVNAGTETFTHTGLVEGTTYYYRISAVDNLGNESIVSNDITSVARTFSANADLSNLTLSLGSLTPSFNPNITSYSLSVGKNISSLNVVPMQDDAYATLQVRVNNGSYATIVSGNPSSSLSLNEGANSIDILVTAEDGTTKTYTITVTRAGISAPLSDHVVISEIYPGGAGASAIYNRDWVELYNPTNEDVDLNNWSLLYASVTGTNIGAKIALSGTIPKHGYYLIAQATAGANGADLPNSPDATGSLAMSFAAGRVALVNNSFTLMPTPGTAGVVDFVGYSTAATFEGSSTAPSPNGSSLERKAISSSTATTMTIGGVDEFKGNGYDSNNNGLDFVLTTPKPQNTSSPIESLTSGNGPTAVTLTSASINENLAAGTTVGTLNSTDADAGDLFSYTLVSGTGDTDNSAFTISGDELRINASPDFETKSSYSIRIKTTDALGLYYQKDFVITINDITELPQITMTGNLNGTTAVYGNASTSQTFNVSGTNMSEGIVVTPPAGFELSLDNTTFTPTLTIGAAGTITDTQIYIRLSASASAGNYGGDISATSAGATTAILNIPSSDVTLNRRYVTMAGAGTKDGSSWANATDNLAGALTASTSGVEVWVAKGTYKPTTTANRGIYFRLNNGVSVYGGFAGTETAISQRDIKTNLTVLSGDIGAPGINTDNSYNLLVVANNTLATTLDGFTIRDGYAFPPGVTSGYTTAGAALYLSNVRNLILKNLIIRENKALNEGAGVFLQLTTAGNNTITFSQVSFIQNRSFNYGGGAFIVYGTQVGTVNLDRCIFDGNIIETADGTVGTGGAFQLAANNTITTFTNCLFTNNIAGGKNDDGGGAIMNYRGIVNVINSTFYNNTTGSTVSPDANTIANVSPGVTNITNSIIWGSAAKHISKPSGTLNLINSLVKGETVTAPNLNSDPLFLNTASLAGGDGILGTADDGLNIRYLSPAKDAASTTGAPALDIAGTSRPQGNGTDMGAYETNAPQPVITATALSGLGAVYGAAPTAGSFTLSGEGMDAVITVTAPTNFEVSTSSTSGFADAITVGSLGNVSSITIYVRLKSGLAVGDYAGDLILSSLGANSITVAANCAVTKIPLTIAAGDVTKTYGQVLANVNAATTFVATGLLPGETIGTVGISYVTGAAATAGVGTYANAVSPSNATGGTFNAANYDITYTSGQITVRPALLTITANNLSKLYGDVLTGASGSAAFTATGLQNGETIGSVTINYGTGSAATAAVNIYNGSVVASAPTGGTFAASNYTINYEAGIISVMPVALLIIPNHVNKVYGTTLTDGATSTGFSTIGLKNGETVGAVHLAYGVGANASTAVGTYPGSVVPSNANGGTFNTQNYNLGYIAGDLDVVAPTIALAPLTLPSATVGTAYSQSVTATGGTAGYTYAVTAGALPPGLTLAADGTLSGTPVAGGTYNFTLTATDSSTGSGPFSGARAYSLAVQAPTIALGPSTLPSATVGTAYSQSVTATGGTAGYTYTVTAGALPPGLTLAADGTLSGTPVAGGTYNFTLTATDSSMGSGPFSGARAYSLAVQAPTIALGPSTLPSATVGTAYSQSVTATGGTAGYTYAVTAGALPPGLTLAADGTLSGTPVAGGTYNFTLTATDSSTGSGPFSGARAYSLAVQAPTIALGPSTLPSATVGTAYSQSVTATGGTAGYTYTVTAGALPPGLTLAADGTLSGTPVAGGTYNFTLTATDSSMGSGPFSGARAYSLAVQAPTIALGPSTLPSATVGTAYSQSVTATGGTAGYTYAVTAGALPPGLSLATNGTISGAPSVVGTFNFTLTARDSSTGSGPFSASRSYSLTVGIGTQVITFNALLDQTYGTLPITLTASSSAGLPITYSSSNNNIASISGNTLTILKAGSVDISATQAGNSSYEAAQTVTRTLTINKAVATIALSDLNQTYDGNSKSPTATTSPASLEGLAITYNGSATVPTAAGSYAITATLTNDNYTAVPATANLVIGKATQSITFDALANRTFNDAPFALTATGGASGNAITYVSSNPAVATISGSTVTIVGAGTTKITASQAGNGNYDAAPDVEQTLTVGKAAQSITFAALANRTFNDAPFGLTATGGASGNAITYVSSNPAVATISGSTVTIVGAGTTRITASQAGNSNYDAAADVEQTLTVGKATQSISFAALANRTFNDAPFALTATGGASGNTITYISSNPAVATISGSTVTIVGAGTTKITASQAGNSNYDAAQDVEQTLMVGKAAQSITFAALANKTFNDVPFGLTATGGNSGNTITYVSSNPAVATISGGTVTIVGAGTTKITASQAGNGNYEAAPDVEQTLTVGKAAQSISFAALANRTFNDAPFGLTATGGASGNTITYVSSNPAVATISGSTVTIAGAGTTRITASQAGNTNYSAAADVEQTLTVGKAAQSISFAALANRSFNDAPFGLTATGGASGNTITFVSSNPAVATISGSTVTIVGAGTTKITASQAGNSNYDAAQDVEQTLTIGKAAQSISFAALANRTFNDAPFGLTATGGASGNTITFVSSNPAVATISGSTVTIAGAGTTRITASQAGNTNYSAAADVEQTLTVGKAAQSISFAALANRSFNDAPFGLTATGGASGNTITFVSSNPAVATISGSTVTIVGAGTTKITASQAGNSNYDAAQDIEQTLTVGKATQSISFAALANRTFNDAPFALTATGGASGNTITYVSSNPAVATISGSTVTIAGAGTTRITASQAGNTNYSAAADVEQTLTVGKAAQSISFAALANRSFNDAPFGLTATGGASGNTITFVSSNPAVATISGSTVTIVGAGTTKITASQAGNSNYDAAQDVEQTLFVGKAAQSITFAALANRTFNDAPFALTATGGASGNTITYVSSNPAVATISGSTVTIAGAGTTRITASQAGNTNYSAAADVEQTLTVGKAAQSISFAALANRSFNDAPFGLTATGGASGNTITFVSSNPAVATISGSTVTIVGAGTTKITASQAGNSNYDAAQDVEQTLTIGKAAQSITFAALASKTFNDAPFALTATGGASGNTITYVSSNPAVATISGSTVTIVGAGTTTITAAQAGNDNYNAAADVQQTLTIGKSAQVISFTPIVDKTYGDAAFDLVATAGTTGNTISYTSSNPSVATVSGNKVTIVGAGSSTITALQAGNDNYLPAAEVSQALTVLQKPVTANFTITSKVYDGSTTAIISNRTLTGIVAADLGEVSLTGGVAVYDNKNAGVSKIVSINRFALSGSRKDNYTLTNTSATSTGTVVPKSLTITADDKEKLQGLPLPSFTAKYDGFIATETIADLTTQPVFSTTATANSPQGTYPIIVNGATAINYTVTFVNGVLKVNPGLPTNITLTAQTLLENAPAGANAGTLSSTSDDPNATFQYSFVSGLGDVDNNLFAIAGNQLRTTASLNYEAKANYSIRVRSTNQYGLSIEQSFAVSLTDVNEVPTLNEIANQTICFTKTQQNVALTGITAGADANQTVSLSLSSTNSALFESLSLSPITGTSAQLHYVPANGASGSAVVTITVTDNGGVANGGVNTYTRTFTININALPVPTITSSAGTTISKGATLVLTASGGVNYQWSNANGIISGQNTAQLTIRPSETTTYRILVSNASGCQEVKEITIVVNSDFQLITGTNLLSPNGDGKNDRLIIRNLDLYPNNELKIFDRAGRILYSKKNYNNEWDGTFNGLPLAEGTYYYIIDFGQKVGVKKGFISIVRD